MERIGDFMIERLAKVQRSRDHWCKKFYRMQSSRDYWRARAHDLQLQVEELTRPKLNFGRYTREEDRLEAIRRSGRDNMRRRRAKGAV